VATLIWAIVAVLVLLWLFGLVLHIGGTLIFLLLVLAIIGVVYNLLAGGMSGGTRRHQHTTEVTKVEHTDV
jgi:Tfp pilus assembly protein FimT